MAKKKNDQREEDQDELDQETDLSEGDGEGEGGGIQQGDKPPNSSGVPPAPHPPASGEKKRIKCDALKGQKITISKGKIVQVDVNGILEVDEEEAARLLTIPIYKEA